MPHKEVLDRLKSLAGVKLYRTDLHGTIVFSTDGLILKVDTQRNDISQERLWRSGKASKEQPKR